MKPYRVTVNISVQADDEDHAYEQALDQIKDGQFTPEIEEAMYIIQNKLNQLYWSNAEGWIVQEEADHFTLYETKTLDLPIDGVWRKI